MSNLDLIKIRAAEIELEINALETRRSILEDERAELSVAQKVLIRLAARVASAGQKLPGKDEAEAGDTSDAPAEGTAKPVGTPTVPEMIMAILTAAKKIGQRGLEPKAIRQYVALKWWPDIPAETVNSIVWRMWKRGQIAKEGTLYMLLASNDPKIETDSLAEAKEPV